MSNFFDKLRFWTTHGLKDVGKRTNNSGSSDENENRVYNEGGGWTVVPDPDDTATQYGIAHAGPIAGPSYDRPPAGRVPMQPGVNPFLGAAAKAGMRVNNPMDAQTAMAKALRGPYGQ
jgi:hypothetical protein